MILFVKKLRSPFVNPNKNTVHPTDITHIVPTHNNLKKPSDIWVCRYIGSSMDTNTAITMGKYI